MMAKLHSHFHAKATLCFLPCNDAGLQPNAAVKTSFVKALLLAIKSVPAMRTHGKAEKSAPTRMLAGTKSANDKCENYANRHTK